MLLLRMQCGLGNQMFQYAAARCQAERMGCGLAYAATREAWRWTTRLRLAVTRPSRHLFVPPFEFERWFTLGGAFPAKNQLLVPAFHARYGLRPRTYREPLAESPGDILDLTTFDPAFFTVRPGTEVSGFFQSERYFADLRDEVRSWFEPKPGLVERARAVAEQTGVGPERRCCIHVRRGDYLAMRNGGAADGWALPPSYYERALEQLPTGLRYVVISDDPGWARRHLGRLEPVVSSRAEAPIVDMLLLGQCRFNIIANSSFSWWGAYLNKQPDARVFFPKYFLGWAFRTELPGGVAVPGWTAVDVDPAGAGPAAAQVRETQ
jgi:hypothetical protein